jgi:nucleotide-binding universal stress UspA family protein
MERPVKTEKLRALICIGDRPLDEKSLHFARIILEAFQLQPTLFHVLHPGETSEDGTARLDASRKMLGIESATVRCIAGDVKKEILNELNRVVYVLLILGTSKRGKEEHPSPLGQDLANRVQVSTLLIRNAPERFHRILVCTGGHDASVNAIDWGIHLANYIHDHVTILHIASSPPSMYTGLDAIDEDLPELLSRDSPLARHLRAAAEKAEQAGVEARLELRHGLVIEEILRSTEMDTHDLVIIGSPPTRAFFNRVILGRIAPKLLSSTRLSTLIIRAGVP